MNQSYTRKAGYGALLAALAALSSVAIAQSVGPDTTLSPDGATARIQRGNVSLAPPAATTGSSAVSDDTANPATQGFTGGDAASTGATIGTTTTPGTSTTPPDTAATGIGVDASGTIQPRTQGFIGAPATTDGADASAQGPLGSDASSPATSGLAGSSAPATGDTVDPGTQGFTARDKPNTGSVGPDAQGFVGSDTTTTGNTGLGIWETGPGNVVTPPTGAPAAGGLQAPPATTVP